MKVDVAGSIRYSWHPGFDQIQCGIRENPQFFDEIRDFTPLPGKQDSSTRDCREKRAECGIRTPLPDPDVTGFA